MKRFNFSLLVIVFFLYACNTKESSSEKKEHEKNTIINGIPRNTASYENSQVNEKNFFTEGNWIFDKGLAIDGLKGNKEYFYNQAQLDTIYSNLIIKIKPEILSIGEICKSNYRVEVTPTNLFFSGKVNDSIDINKFFMDSFQIKLPDSLRIIYLLNCENPFKRILLFPTHLIVLEYGAFYFSFKKDGRKTSETRRIDNCKDVTVEMGSGKECFFENTSITNAYTQLINSNEVADSRHLLKVLPRSNQIIKVEDNGLISIEYKWMNLEQLEIEFFYNGGSTDIKLTIQGDGVLRGIYKYAD